MIRHHARLHDLGPAGEKLFKKDQWQLVKKLCDVVTINSDFRRGTRWKKYGSDL